MDELHQHFATLEIPEGSRLREVKAAHQELVTVWHPDRFPENPSLKKKASEKLRGINRAYKAIKQHYASQSAPKPKPPMRTPFQ